jgi:hypothetical protein
MFRLHVRGDARRRAARHTGAAALLSLISSCTGTIGGPLGAGPVVGGHSSLCQGAAPQPGPSFIRRVNRLEYNNTVRDLLGDLTHPADAFPAEEKRLGFDNNADALSVSPVLAEQYMLAAEALAATAVDARWAALVPCAAGTTGAAAIDACGTSSPRSARRPIAGRWTPTTSRR